MSGIFRTFAAGFTKNEDYGNIKRETVVPSPLGIAK
jgi:hypothetical protein